MFDEIIPYSKMIYIYSADEMAPETTMDARKLKIYRTFVASDGTESVSSSSICLTLLDYDNCV